MHKRIVEITGGLGNQMFQYAFGIYLSKKYPDNICIDDLGYYSAANAIRMYELEKVFGIKIDEALDSEIRTIRGYNPLDNAFQKAMFKLFHSKNNACEILEDLDRAFDEDYISSDRDSYYSGYWQCEKYFKPFRNDIFNAFSFRNLNLSEQCKRIAAEIEGCDSVAVHIRLEDYLKEDNYKIYGNICTKEYYSRALEYITKKVPTCKFYVFSTDIKGALDMLPSGYEYIPVEYDGQRGDLDMYLMTRCKHNIIANSTFSWWGAWLNNNMNKTVLCPSRWLNNHDINNQLCEDWIKILI